MFFGTASTAQDYSAKIEGRVYSKDGDVASTHILNISLQRFTIADIDGFFSIPVRVNDTLVFSAVQFKKKEIVITKSYMEQKRVLVFMEEALNELDEVVVTPYNLTGELDRDMKRIKIETVVTSSTLGLPNAYVKVKTQNERKLFEADNGKWASLTGVTLDSTFGPAITININKIINRITGRTQKLKEHIARDVIIGRIQRVKQYYPDSLYAQEFKIPEYKIADFMYFCQTDSSFNSIADTYDQLKIWNFLRKKSLIYRENNALD